MKKIYKSFAVVALTMMANVAFGQNLKVTADGKPVADGDVIELPYELFVDDYPEWGMTFYSAIWDPHLEASTVDGATQLTVTLTSIDASGFQLCWPDGCQATDPGKTVSASGSLTTVPQDLQIHKSQDLESPDEVPSAPGSVKVKLQSGFEIMEITIIGKAEDKNGVEENWTADNQPTVYYTLEGLQVENPTKGIYVARKGAKSRLVYKK